MIFEETPLTGAFTIEIEPHRDERGFFARTWCAEELAAHGLDPQLAQASVSYNSKKGTLRGLHLQIAPHEETKIVRCTRGAIQDAIVDLRPGSKTFGQSFTTELTEQKRNQLYVPGGFAHGFLTLEDETEVSYNISTPYAPGFQRGYRFDDPKFGISWQASPSVISERDQAWTLWDGEAP